MIEEDLSECDRIKLLLNKRDPNQYGYVFLNAVSIFRNDLEMQGEIIPILVEKIREYSEDQQIIAGDAFSELIEEKVGKIALWQTRCFHTNGLVFNSYEQPVWIRQTLIEWILTCFLFVQILDE